MKFVFLICCALAALVSSHGAGLSDPNIVVYGKVFATMGAETQTIYAGDLSWTVTPSVGAPFTIPVALENLGGGLYSYRLDIPAEKVPSGATLSRETLEATTVVKACALAATFNGEAATLHLANAIFIPAPSASANSPAASWSASTSKSPFPKTMPMAMPSPTGGKLATPAS